jgi:hypothetical protein
MISNMPAMESSSIGKKLSNPWDTPAAVISTPPMPEKRTLPPVFSISAVSNPAPICSPEGSPAMTQI